MNSTATLQNEYLPIGAPSSPSAPPSAEIVYREFGVARALPLPNTTSLSSFIDEIESDPTIGGHLAEARRQLATDFYANERETLNALRLSAGFSQTQLAARAGTTQPYIARMERGQVDPSTDMIARIAQALGINEETTFSAIRTQRRTRG